MKMKKIVINISGFTFEVTDECLSRFPNTLLGNPVKRRPYFIPTENAYFFNRHRIAFEGILMYYQCYGRVVCPELVPDEVFKIELEFFLIECEYLQEAKEAKKYVLESVKTNAYENNIRSRVWRMMENPQSSIGAQIVSATSLLMTVASITFACLFPGDKNEEPRMHQDTFPFELMCFLWFSLEYGIRLWTCPSKIKFLKSWIDITDLTTLVVFYSSLALTSTEASSTSVLRVFRLANAFRVFRLTRFSNGLRLLIYTIYKSRTDLQLLSGLLAIFILITGSMIYFAEAGVEGNLFHGGIFDGIWFSVISCTTVGYGDIVPISPLGKLVASLTITFGAMLILLPVLKLVTSFSEAIDSTRALLASNGDIQMQGIKTE